MAKIKQGARTVKAPPLHPSFVRGSRPQSLRDPTPKAVNTRDYGKTEPKMTNTGFGNTGLDRAGY